MFFCYACTRGQSMTKVAPHRWGLASCRDATCRVSRHEHLRFQIRRGLWTLFATGLLACVISLGAASPATSIDHRASSSEILPSYFRTGVLDMEARIWAQTQIERVYYNHRIWPKENPGPKPPFEQMVPAALIAKKAAEPLRMSAALKQFWNVEITPAMLQAEMDRMERQSKDRATLRELFAALHDDPFLIAETLALAHLCEPALRSHYDFDPGLHADARKQAEILAMRVKAGARWSELDAVYARGSIGREESEKDNEATLQKQGRTGTGAPPGETIEAVHNRLKRRAP